MNIKNMLALDRGGTMCGANIKWKLYSINGRYIKPKHKKIKRNHKYKYLFTSFQINAAKCGDGVASLKKYCLRYKDRT